MTMSIKPQDDSALPSSDNIRLEEQFFNICENGDVAQAKNMLASGADPMRKNRAGESILHLAVKSGNPAMVEYLLENIHIHIDVRDAYGRTPLHWAARLGHEQIVERLLIARADITIKDDSGIEPQTCAEMGGYKSIIKMLDFVRKLKH